MYDSLAIPLLIIGGILLIVLLLGLILSIVIFSTKSIIAEVTAWICASLWLVLDLLMLKAETFRKMDLPNVFLFVILATFFLLLHYRSRTAQGNMLKVLFVLKASIVMLLLDKVLELAYPWLANAGVVDFGNRSAALAVTAATSALSVIVMTFLCIAYLRRLGRSVSGNEAFTNALVFAVCADVVCSIIATGLFLLEYAASLMYMGDYFKGTNWLLRIAFIAGGGAIAALIATYVHQKKYS